MRERYIWSFGPLSVKCTTYWQSVLRFGLPSTILYFGVDYAGFRITAGNAGLHYPWRSVAISDVAYLFILSTLWWALMRHLATLKRKSQQAAGPNR
jgi:hypothetical protein